MHVGQNPVGNATAEKISAAVENKELDCPVEPYIDYAKYRELHEHSFPVDGGDYPLPIETTGPYRLAGLFGHKRVYVPR